MIKSSSEAILDHFVGCHAELDYLAPAKFAVVSVVVLLDVAKFPFGEFADCWIFKDDKCLEMLSSSTKLIMFIIPSLVFRVKLKMIFFELL